MSARWPTAVLCAALASAALLVGIGLAGGGLTYGAAPAPRDACAPHAPFTGGGLDGATQRVALRGLDSAACELGLTREDLLFGLAGQEDVGHSSAEMESALRRGLEKAVDQEDLDPVSSFVLRKAIEYTPADWVLAVARKTGLLDSSP